MKILGLDIATNSGICVLNDGKLETYKTLNIPSEMNLFQRIGFFENNIIQILNDYNPDYVAIEDLIMGISGVKVLSYLARLGGVALSCCIKKVGNNIALYTPAEWKANSFDGLNGMSKKYEIQLAVCRHFELINKEQLDAICKPLSEIKDNTDSIKPLIEDLTKETKKYIAYLNRKSDGSVDKRAFQNKVTENKSTIEKYKKMIDDNKKKIESVYKNISLEIMSKCGLNCDVSDSIGIAYCLYRKLNNL